MENKDIGIFPKIKVLARDIIWTIAALVLMNCVAQLLIYPLWAKVFSDEQYGNIIYAMSIVNTLAVSVGIACNYARMAEASRRATKCGDYNIMLLFFGVIVAMVCFLLTFFGDLYMTLPECILVALLAVLTMWRYYADVEYRLSLDYKGYFAYYFHISLGYLFGLVLFHQVRIWPLAMIPGELFGLVRIAYKGSMFKSDALRKSDEFKANCNAVMVLFATQMISNIIFNGDRILLQIFIGGSAVTVYYLASLAGKTMSLVTTPLNSVIIGYLSRFKSDFSQKTMNLFTATTLAAIALGTFVAVIGSHVLIPILYAGNYMQVKEFFLVANLTQVIYFVSNIVTTIMLRIAKTNRQLIVNMVYAVAFLMLCIPAALRYGISGFCFALLMANVVRYVMAIICCYLSIGWRR